MRTILTCVLLGVGAFLVAASVVADPPPFTVKWRFEAKFIDITNTYNENLHTVVDVWLPAEMRWQCQRLSPVVVEGRQRASFICSNDGWKTRVLTMVGCRLDGPDAPRTAAMRVWGPPPPQGADAGAPDGGAAPMGKFVDLTVTCETVATK